MSLLFNIASFWWPSFSSRPWKIIWSVSNVSKNSRYGSIEKFILHLQSSSKKKTYFVLIVSRTIFKLLACPLSSGVFIIKSKNGYCFFIISLSSSDELSSTQIHLFIKNKSWRWNINLSIVSIKKCSLLHVLLLFYYFINTILSNVQICIR